MKYFVIADVHGFYDEMIEALNKAGFDKFNKEHTLISLGDVIDRGTQPNEVIEYLLSLERKILIRGNHEDLLYQLLCYQRNPAHYDVTNGTFDTIIRLANKTSELSYDIDSAYSNWHECVLHARGSKIFDYLNETVNYFETERNVFVHGWAPGYYNYEKEKYCAYTNLENVEGYEWADSRWVNSLQMAQQKVFIPGKQIVCGHWHACDFNTYFNNDEKYKNHDPYITDDFIALDACTVLSKKVNVIIIEE